MGIANFYKQQDQDNTTFEQLRDKAWIDMKQRHEHLIAAFQGKENLPENQQKQIEKELADYTKQWAIPNGEKYKVMQAEQDKQFNTIAKDVLPKAKVQKPSNPYIESLAITRAVKQQSSQRVKNPEKFKAFDQNKKQMDLDRDI